MESYSADLARFHTLDAAARRVPQASRGAPHGSGGPGGAAQSGAGTATDGAAGDDPRLREVTQEFEAIFIKQMLDSMRATRDSESDLLHGGMAEEFFEDMLYDEYAKLMAKTGDFGLGEVLYRELSGR